VLKIESDECIVLSSSVAYLVLVWMDQLIVECWLCRTNGLQGAKNQSFQEEPCRLSWVRT